MAQGEGHCAFGRGVNQSKKDEPPQKEDTMTEDKLLGRLHITSANVRRFLKFLNARGGKATVEEVIKRDRFDNSPMFNWDEEDAAHRFRCIEAESLLADLATQNDGAARSRLPVSALSTTLRRQASARTVGLSKRVRRTTKKGGTA
jgi:hypothetical protein